MQSDRLDGGVVALSGQNLGGKGRDLGLVEQRGDRFARRRRLLGEASRRHQRGFDPGEELEMEAFLVARLIERRNRRLIGRCARMLRMRQAGGRRWRCVLRPVPGKPSGKALAHRSAITGHGNALPARARQKSGPAMRDRLPS